jgi:hypothetical protein
MASQMPGTANPSAIQNYGSLFYAGRPGTPQVQGPGVGFDASPTWLAEQGKQQIYGQDQATQNLQGPQDQWVQPQSTDSANYGSYMLAGNQAQQMGAAAQPWATQDQNVGNAVNMAQAQAQAPTAQQMNAYSLMGNMANGPSSMQGGAAGNLAQIAAGTSAPQQQMAMSNALLGQAAMGNAPSAAQAQLQAGLNQSQAQAQAMANSTRGQFGLANAQRAAMGAQANMASQASNQAAQLRANEMANARSAYAQGTQAAGNLQASGAQAYGAFANQQNANAIGAAQNYGQYANQQFGAQTNAIQNAGNLAAGQQNAALNYYTQQQNALLQQQNMASQLSQADVNAMQNWNNSQIGSEEAGNQMKAQVAGSVMSGLGQLASSAAPSLGSVL